ncbi:putative Serine/threonine-protein phosphatase [Blattamonas nauphoetae]|uniref:Serine/threonine-protein phosphatase n=1 Tax=Blattamonas nauphoetae TaxID=2049346 RepID=A0ABQ9X430_9EUKA|nr:putative Serine/threonine-protein phosphatase [Blattamonas nauphoetae]
MNFIKSIFTNPSELIQPLQHFPDVTSETIVELEQILTSGRKPPITQVISLIKMARESLQKLPNILEIPYLADSKMTIVGDTHGQFYDVLHIFKENGYPSATNRYIFNGDFVDRGSFGSELTLLLLTLYLVHPESLFLLRGNHECARCTFIYGFKDEVLDKYNEDVYTEFVRMFYTLPLCAIVCNRVFVVHGGLWEQPDISFDDIRSIQRFKEPGTEGGHLLMAQMLWSDPQPANGFSKSIRPFGVNFGPDITASFLTKHNLNLFVRSHQAKEMGYSVEHEGFLITIFSAPDYCGCNNFGAYLHLLGEECNPEFIQFQASPHPRCKQYFPKDDCILF